MRQEDIPLDPHDLIRFGSVKSVDLASGTCVVEIGDPQEGAIETPPVKWRAGRAGKTRMWSPPSVGEQVLLLCPGGDLAAAVTVPGVYSSAYPANGDSLTEILEFGDGAVLSYDTVAHVLVATLPEGGTAQITAPGGLSITGDVTITGTVTVSEDVTAGGISLKNHVHGGVQAGGTSTGAPQ